MSGFTSYDDLINEATVNGKIFNAFWNKNFLPTTAAVAGEWHNLARGGGNPAADALYNTGTNLLFNPTSDTTTNAGGIPHGGNVYPDYKTLVAASALSAAATTMPAFMVLVDIIGYIRVTSVTTITSQAITNTLSAFSTFTAATDDILTSTGTLGFANLFPYTRVQVSTTTTLPAGLSAATDYYVIKLSDTTIKLATSYANAVAGTAIDITSTGSGTHTLNTLLPRYTSGAGVQAMLWNTNATPLGAATPNLSFPAYTNSAQATGRATPTVLPVGKTAAANGLILYSGTGAGKYGPAMPLQGGDSGIAKIDNVQISASYVSGEFSIALYKHIATIPLTTLGVAGERDFVNMIPSFPRIYDGANLHWLLYSGAATPVNSAFYGTLDTIWG